MADKKVATPDASRLVYRTYHLAQDVENRRPFTERNDAGTPGS